MTAADEIRAALAAEMAKPRRNRRKIEELEWALDRATATAAVNARRASMGLDPWADGRACA